MSKELPKAYDPQKYEDSIYKKWEESDFFNPDTCVKEGVCKKDADTYTIILPPPNITDKLHLGHVVMVAVSDILIRYNRMNGKKTLWVPGTDHAAIATQNVVEKKLLKEEKGITTKEIEEGNRLSNLIKERLDNEPELNYEQRQAIKLEVQNKLPKTCKKN